MDNCTTSCFQLYCFIIRDSPFLLRNSFMNLAYIGICSNAFEKGMLICSFLKIVSMVFPYPFFMECVDKEDVELVDDLIRFFSFSTTSFSSLFYNSFICHFLTKLTFVHQTNHFPHPSCNCLTMFSWVDLCGCFRAQTFVLPVVRPEPSDF